MPAVKYRLADGSKPPSVTQVIGVLDKPAIAGWNYSQGWAYGYDEGAREALDLGMIPDTSPPDWKLRYTKRDAAATAGTLAHQLVEAHLTGQFEPDVSDYPEAIRLKAEGCMLSFLEWERAHEFKIVESEKSLVSEKHRYGGTIDIGAVLGEMRIIDLKTSKDVYFSMKVQVAAYEQLWNENFPEKKVVAVDLLRIGEDGGFSHHYYPDLSAEFGVFLNCLGIYRMLKETSQKL